MDFASDMALANVLFVALIIAAVLTVAGCWCARKDASAWLISAMFAAITLLLGFSLLEWLSADSRRDNAWALLSPGILGMVLLLGGVLIDIRLGRKRS